MKTEELKKGWKTKKILIVVSYILTLFWMIIPNEVFFKLIVIMLLMALTIEELKQGDGE